MRQGVYKQVTHLWTTTSFVYFILKGFVMALGYAAIALSILALLLPSAMAFKSRTLNQRKYQVLGGGLVFH